MAGNPKVRVEEKVLEEYRRIATRLGVRLGELVSAVLAAALEDKCTLLAAAERVGKKKGWSTYEQYVAVKKLLERGQNGGGIL